MTGGLMQLVHKGAEDAYFNLHPDSGIWRGVFKRVSNFAVEPAKMSWKTEPAFGGTCTLSVPRLGDLLAGVVMQVTVRKLAGDYTAAYFPMEALFEQISVWLDGQRLDSHTSDFFRVYNTLHRPYDSSEKYKRLANFDPAVISSGDPATSTFMFPLMFSFCRSPGCALPLVSMPFSEVSMQFTLSQAAAVGLDPSVLDVQVYGDYVFVDTAEREALKKPYDVLVEQLQTKTFTLPEGVPSINNPTTFAAKFNLFRPVKSLYFFLRHEFGEFGRYFGNQTEVPLALTADVSTPSGLCMVAPIPDSLSPILEAKFSFDGVERTPRMPFVYFNRVLPLQYCVGQPLPGVGVMPFGLHPETLAPKGTCNMSVIDEVRLDLTLKRNASAPTSEPTAALDIGSLRKLVVMAWGYNILRVEGGRATVIFA